MVAIGTMILTAPKRWGEMAKVAEEAGFESVWVPEHLIMPVKMSGKPNSPTDGEPPISAKTPAFDPWVQIAVMAAQTSTLRFGTNVYNIGLRHPFVTARAVATVDAASNGRLEFGIGASWLSEEWQATQLPFATRGRRVDETIEIVKRLFTEEVIEHEGEFFKFQPVGFLPKPVQSPWPPMHIGGDSKAAMRRAALLGDGWIPMEQTTETLPANLKLIEQMRSDAGRSGPFHVTMSARVSSVDDVKRYVDAGVTRLLVTPFTNPREAADGYRRFGDEVLSKL
ncbi:MAG: LLM class F420-dependent oxidoreductase [Acidimicrobiia bacterium]